LVEGGVVGNDLKVFEYDGWAEIRTVTLDGDPWWVAADVCEVLGTDTSNLSKVLEEDERRPYSIRTSGGVRQATVISEPGLYSLILRSRKPEAREFKRWITHTVIPAIRKTGGYLTPGVVDADDPDQIASIMEASFKMSQALKAKNARLTAELAEATPKAEFFDHLTSANGSYSMDEAAKILGTGRIRLYRWLRDNGYCMSRSKGNMPYQQYITADYFDVKTSIKRYASGEEFVNYKIRMTAKGLDFFRPKLADSLFD
jgi:prophage antirepressor-like protein